MKGKKMTQKKKQVKHFVPNKDDSGSGIPACNGYNSIGALSAWESFGEVAKTRRGVTCGRCRRTRVFRKLK